MNEEKNDKIEENKNIFIDEDKLYEESFDQGLSESYKDDGSFEEFDNSFLDELEIEKSDHSDDLKVEGDFEEKPDLLPNEDTEQDRFNKVVQNKLTTNLPSNEASAVRVVISSDYQEAEKISGIKTQTKVKTEEEKIAEKKMNIFLYLIVLVPLLLVLLYTVITLNNSKVRIARKYCKYLKTKDIKYIDKYKVDSSEYLLADTKDLEEDNFKCRVISTGKELDEDELYNLNRSIEKKEVNYPNINKAYKLVINYKIKDFNEIYENKKELIIFKNDKEWKLINPNILD